MRDQLHAEMSNQQTYVLITFLTIEMDRRTDRVSCTDNVLYSIIEGSTRIGSLTYL
jgi:hypothetical protein